MKTTVRQRAPKPPKPTSTSQPSPIQDRQELNAAPLAQEAWDY